MQNEKITTPDRKIAVVFTPLGLLLARNRHSLQQNRPVAEKARISFNHNRWQITVK